MTVGRTFAAAGAVIAALAVAVPAHATFPGRNGEIAYLDSFGTDYTETELWQVCSDGSRDRRFLSGGLDHMDSAAFSPNGRWLAAAGTDAFDAFPHISVGAVAGRRLRRVSRPPQDASDAGPVWSPNGGAIAFTRTRYDRDFDVRSRAVRMTKHESARDRSRSVRVRPRDVV